MPLILVSACLLGQRCKYDGGHNRSAAVLRFLDGKDCLPVCPESAVLPAPRPPVEIRAGRVVTADGRDRTALYCEGVRRTLRALEGRPVACAVLKARSPTCGAGRIYDGTFTHTAVPGDGLLARALKARGIPVYTEEDIERNPPRLP